MQKCCGCINAVNNDCVQQPMRHHARHTAEKSIVIIIKNKDSFFIKASNFCVFMTTENLNPDPVEMSNSIVFFFFGCCPC